MLVSNLKEANELGFSIVYQGGHHNVYCNGERHFNCGGGFTGSSSSQDKEIAYANSSHVGGMRFSYCDCSHWSDNA